MQCLLNFKAVPTHYKGIQILSMCQGSVKHTLNWGKMKSNTDSLGKYSKTFRERLSVNAQCVRFNGLEHPKHPYGPWNNLWWSSKFLECVRPSRMKDDERGKSFLKTWRRSKPPVPISLISARKRQTEMQQMTNLQRDGNTLDRLLAARPGLAAALSSAAALSPLLDYH